MNYYERGIRVCDRWMRFENFLADMGHPQGEDTLDRIDPNGNYEPSNCRWLSKALQMRNTRRNKVVDVNGQTMLLCDAIAMLRKQARPLHASQDRSAS